MIITLMGADFSASNIGTLSSWRISRSLGAGATYEGVTSVDKSAAFSATVTLAEGYEIGTAGVVITMGGAVLSGAHSISGNVITITIASVTGNVLIKVPTVNVNTGEEEEPEVPSEPDVPAVDPKAAIIDLTLANVTDGILRNVGTGGSTYNATIVTPKSGDSYTSNEDGLTLINHAYANTPYGFKASDKFTISVRGAYTELNENQYQRLFRTDQDMPCGFYSYTTGSGIGVKLAGASGNDFTAHDNRVYIRNLSTNAALNTAYILPENLDEENMHTYTLVGDGSKIYYYLDGVLMASQNASVLKTSTYIGMGDNDETKNYYAAKVSFEHFRIYNYAMTAEEVTALTQN